jgi:glycosyltransferase involved in cell wall biosynthesis
MIGAVHTIAGLRETSGGVSRSVPTLCEALARRGLRTVLISQAIRNAPSNLLTPDAALVKSILVPGFDWPPLRASFTPGLGAVLESACREAQPCLIHDHGVWLHANHIAAKTARRLDLRRIVSPRGMLEGWSLQHRRVKKRIAWIAYQRRDLSTADAFCATSEGEAHAIVALGLSRPVAVIPNGVEAAPPHPRPPRSDTSRRLVFLSRLHPKKGLLDLVAAWSKVPRDGWTLTIAGPDEGGHRREVEAAAAHAGVGHQITFAGAVEGAAKSALLASADLFALPSYSENFGMAIAEALAAGVPVITTRATPWGELQSLDCGWWIETGVEPLAAALREAMGLSDARRAEMGANGTALMSRRYSWASVADRHIELYQWVAGAGPRPDFVLE